MGEKATLKITETVPELKKLLSKQTKLKGEKRVRALLNIKLNRARTRQDLADCLQIHIRTLERWLNTYKTAGIEVMLKVKPRNKGPRIISEQIHQGLAKRVTGPNNPFLGYWDAQRWVQASYGVEVKYHRIREYLIQHFGTKVKTPRRSHVNKDQQAEASFLKTASDIRTY